MRAKECSKWLGLCPGHLSEFAGIYVFVSVEEHTALIDVKLVNSMKYALQKTVFIVT